MKKTTDKDRTTYVACPWTPKGGGMYKVADYLLQQQASEPGQAVGTLRPLDTRGGGNAVSSLAVLGLAMTRLIRDRLRGQVAGVHVNMAERLSVFRKGAIIALCRALRIPVVLHLHAAQLHHFYRNLPRLLQVLVRWLFSLPTHCIVLGHAARNFVVDELAVAPEKVSIVINGVPGPTASRRKRQPGTPCRALFLGNLSERKGVSDLLRAIARSDLTAERFILSLAGGGDIAGYRKLVDDLQIGDRVHFEGWADQEKAAGLMAAADMLLLPSYDEGLPLVILEALANGVAVICTPVGEIPSVLEDGVHAYFVNPGDIAGIADALHRLVHDEALREQLEFNGRAIYEAQFSLSRFFFSIVDIHRANFLRPGRHRAYSAVGVGESK